MSSQPNLQEMFQEWNELNTKTQESMGQFDFSTIKKIRESQKKINKDKSHNISTFHLLPPASHTGT